MNEQIISNSPAYEWVLMENCIGLKKGTTEEAISAADIVRFEYKEKKIFNGIEVRSRPSEKLKNLNKIKSEENVIQLKNHLRRQQEAFSRINYFLAEM